MGSLLQQGGLTENQKSLYFISTQALSSITGQKYG